MKKTIFKMTMVLFISVIAFSGCKKGEDDPGISFRSRTARFAGDWKLTTMDYTETRTNNGSTSTYHYTYDGVNITTTSTFGGNSYTDKTVYSLNISTTKDGTYNTTEVDDGDTSLGTGNWLWVRGNKEQDLEKKEAVLFTSTSNTSNGSTETYSGKTNLDGVVMVLKKLSNKEIVFLFDYTYTNSDGYTYNKVGTQTFVQ